MDYGIIAVLYLCTNAVCTYVRAHYVRTFSTLTYNGIATTDIFTEWQWQ